MIELLAPLAFVLQLFRGELLPPAPRCEPARPCSVWTGRSFSCMRGSCAARTLRRRR